MTGAQESVIRLWPLGGDPRALSLHVDRIREVAPLGDGARVRYISPTGALEYAHVRETSAEVLAAIYWADRDH